MDRWVSQTIMCSGGLDLSQTVLSQGTDDKLTGTAIQLQNFESDIGGGYRRINGFQKYDTNVVTGKSGTPVVGVLPVFNKVFAARMNAGATGVEVYSSGGAGWTKLTTASRSTSVTKVRFLHYFVGANKVVLATDGYGYAWRYVVGTGDTLINGTGAPTDPKYSEYHLGRLALAGQSAAPQTLVLSSSADDTVFDGAMGALSFSVGDDIKGLKTFRQELYIFCETSIWKLTGTTPDGANNTQPFQIVSVTKDIGCLSHDTIQEVGGDLIYLAPDGLRSIAATNRIGDVEISSYSFRINELLTKYTTGYTEDNYSSCQVRTKSQYRLFVQQSGAPDGSAVGFLGKYLTNKLPESYGQASESYEWATLSGINAYCSDSNYEGGTEIVVFGHPSDGFVYQMEKGVSFNGANINAVYQSPHITFTNPVAKSDESNRKVLQKVNIYIKQEGNIDTTLSSILDLGSAMPQPPSIELTQNSSAASYGVAVYGTDKYAAIQYPIFKEDLIGSCFTASFIYASNNTSDPYRIDSYNIQFAPKGKR